MPNVGLPEMLLIAAIIVLIFGASKLPQLGRGLGEGIRNFRDAVKKGSDSEKDGDRDE